jgi:hypothetical protein
MKCFNGDIKWHFKRDCWCYNPILTHLLFNLILKGLKFKIKRSGAWMQNFKNFKDQMEKWLPQSVTTLFRHFHSSSSSLWKQRKLPVTKQQCRSDHQAPWSAYDFRYQLLSQFSCPSPPWHANNVKETTTNSPIMAGLLVSRSNQNTKSQTLSSWRSLPPGK